MTFMKDDKKWIPYSCCGKLWSSVVNIQENTKQTTLAEKQTTLVNLLP